MKRLKKVTMWTASASIRDVALPNETNLTRSELAALFRNIDFPAGVSVTLKNLKRVVTRRAI